MRLSAKEFYNMQKLENIPNINGNWYLWKFDDDPVQQLHEYIDYAYLKLQELEECKEVESVNLTINIDDKDKTVLAQYDVNWKEDTILLSVHTV